LEAVSIARSNVLTALPARLAARARAWDQVLPSLTRPAFDLRCGAASLLERQRRFFAEQTTTSVNPPAARVRPELADLCPHTQVLAARLRGSSLGPQCRVGGEVEASILQGYANKAHDGFLGHAYLGQWVNLGAGTHSSDLRNDYRSVRLRVAGREVDTGLLKVGCFVGDHVKSSIGVLLNTGTAVGPFAQLLACGSLLPRWLPAFSQVAQGRLQERTDLRVMFATAATVLGRRGQVWSESHADFFLDLYARTAAERRQAIHDADLRRLRWAM
jgi:hypothetical protein